ncbi:MAG: MiaB/RimO family radical SAM methylthiotransferase [Candidatus Berkelbacteria bacterium]|nr:MiaB/RimO family radical SAM methylthiotransferase [Candidatus Berkelbacteria bacterium]
MKFCIETIGCQQNEYDAANLATFLKSNGFFESSPEESDRIFILACSVRQTAVDRIFGRVRNYQKAGKKVYITACVTDADKKKLKELGVVYFENFDQISEIFELPTTNYQLPTNLTSYIPIMTGCNNFCSYCIVPFTRGREKSRPIEEIISEAKNHTFHFSTAKLRSEKLEIILLGQNVNSYKIDQKTKIKNQNDKSKIQKEKTDFVKLLKEISKIDGDFQISFLSNHPKDVGDDLIEAIATLPKVKKEIHLPLQSGSDKILKAMNRPYTSQQYLDLVENCKLKIENLKITTDIIVGFPGETEEDFQQTVEVCKKVGFALGYINKYSPRHGTASYKLGDPISWAEKQRRWKILDELINKKIS